MYRSKKEDGGLKRITLIPLHASLRFFLVCSLLISFCLLSGIRDTDAAADDNRAADFTLKDLQGRDVRLSDYKGRTILLCFMATWCRDCRAAMPHLKELHSLYSAKGLIILNINVSEPREKAEAFAKKYALPYPTLLDVDGQVAKMYGVFGVPVEALINDEGRIICWNCRFLDKLLEKQFEMKEKRR